MNCPYCDETIHAMAKFCPKCGLPLKDDQTLMGGSGAYVTDDGPNWTLIGGAGAAVAAIALAIGFLGSRGNQPADTVQRQPVGSYSTPSPAPSFGFAAPTPYANVAPAYQSLGGGAASMTNTKPRWAYVPPPTPAIPAVFNGPLLPEGPEAPRHLVLNSPLVMQRRPPVVQVAQSNEPAIPVIPPSELMYLNGGAQNAPTTLDLTPEAALNTEIARREADGIWVYDPVQERWAFRPEAKVRRSTRRAPRGVVPVPSFPNEPHATPQPDTSTDTIQ